MRRLTATLVFTIAFLLIWQSVSFPINAQDATPTRIPTLAFNEGDYSQIIIATLNSVPSVQSTVVNRQRGQRVVTITYATEATEATVATERVDEWMAILAPLATVLRERGLVVDQIILIANKGEMTSGRFTVLARDLLNYHDGKLTRARLLGRAKYVSLEPTPTRIPRPVRPTRTPRPTIEPTTVPVQQPAVNATCPSTSFTCKQFVSCEQARACLAAGNRRLDGDNDGIPCENLCG